MEQPHNVKSAKTSTLLTSWHVLLSCCVVSYFVMSWWILFGVRGTYKGAPLLFLMILFLGIALFLGSLVVIAVATFFKQESWSLYGIKGIIISLFIFALFVPLLFSESVFNRDLKHAQTFCERLIPPLEQIKTATGEYPVDISDLLSQERLPHLLHREHFYYYSDGKEFVFDIHDQGMMIVRGWKYSSSTQEWQGYAD